MPKQIYREREAKLSTVNEEERSVRLSFASETPVIDCWGDKEILRCNESACKLDRGVDGVMCALFNHDRNVIIGHPTDFSFENGKAYCTIRFAETEKAQEVYSLVKDGHLNGVSVGYRVNRYDVVEPGARTEDGIEGPAYIATDWEVFEVSIVSVPADASVGVGRSMQYVANNEKEERKVSEMPEQKINVEAERAAAVTAERERISAIESLCKQYDLPAEQRSAWLANGTSLNDAKLEALDIVAKRNAPKPVAIETGKDDLEKRSAAYVDGLCLRHGVKKAEYAEGAQQMRGLSQRDLARQVLMDQGERSVMFMSDAELLQRALTTGAFAGILDRVVRASVSQGYNEAQTTYKAWAQIGSLPDFKATKRVQLAAGVEPETIAENGEFTYADFAADGVDVQLSTDGIAWKYTRQAFINDDLSILTKIPAREAAAFARKINRLAYIALASVAKGVTGTALTTATMDAARQYLRKQTIKDGNKKQNVKLNLAPTHVIVPPEMELAAYQMINSTADPSGANSGVANGFRNSLIPVCDANLAANAWYLLAGNNQVDTIEVSFLNGVDVPVVEAQDEFNSLARSYRMYLDFGVKLLDSTGICKVAQ